MTTQAITTLGGSASHIKVGKVALGLMMMTLTPNIVSDEQAFEAIKAGVDSLPPGVKMFLNSADFYAKDFGLGNLELLSRFYEKYPDYADKTFLSVKGGILRPTTLPFKFDSSEENLRQGLQAINAALRGKKKVDLFECARVDPKIPIEEAMKNMQTLVNEGFFDHIGLSEVSAQTVRRAAAVASIAAIEIEVSFWAIEEETKKVLAVAEELGVPVIAYSPLGRGFLTGTINKPEDIPEGDIRRYHTRFNKEEYFKQNLKMVDQLKAIAERKGVTPAALCIAWVSSLGPKVIPLPGSSNPKRTQQNVAAADITINPEEGKQIWDIINTFNVQGDRGIGLDPEAAHFWG